MGKPLQAPNLSQSSSKLNFKSYQIEIFKPNLNL